LLDSHIVRRLDFFEEVNNDPFSDIKQVKQYRFSWDATVAV